MPAVRLRGLTRAYGPRSVLDGIDLQIAPGEFVALLGRSGGGKTTLLRVLAGLDHDTTGGGDIQVPARRAVVFQDARLLPWKRVLANITLGLRGSDVRRRAELALDEVGLLQYARAWPGRLSGGEQQRAALARALVRQPELLLADEPFGALDALTRMRMHALLSDLHLRHRPAVLMVTHDVEEAVLLADRVLLLDHGRICLDRPVSEPRPRNPGSATALEHRRVLLTALGIPPPAPEADAQGPDPTTPPGVTPDGPRQEPAAGQ